MQQILDLVRNQAAADYAAGRDHAVVAALNTATIRRADATMRTARWLVVTFSPEESGLILGTLQNAAAFGPLGPFIRAGYDSLVSDGLDLSHDTTQALIEQVGTAAGWPTDLIAKLKAHGVWHVSPAMATLARDLTLEDVAEARAYDTAVFQQQQLSLRWAGVYNTLNAEINEKTLTTIEQLRERATELLA